MGELRIAVLATLLFWLVFAAGYVRADEGAVALGDYPLDGVARTLAPGQALPCAGQPLVDYRGTTLTLQKPARVHPAFLPKLVALERLVAEVATPIYGRAPRTLVHLGTHNCRRMRRYPDWLSEHALGNAIDLAGFDFGPLAKGQQAPEGLPRVLQRGFSVRLERHFRAKGARAHAPAALHQRFLRTLAQRLIERPDLFRTVLGPAWPGHHNHFHLDFAPYRVVEVFAAGEAP